MIGQKCLSHAVYFCFLFSLVLKFALPMYFIRSVEFDLILFQTFLYSSFIVAQIGIAGDATWHYKL